MLAVHTKVKLGDVQSVRGLWLCRTVDYVPRLKSILSSMLTEKLKWNCGFPKD